MTAKQARMIEKLERHRAGPIELTQAECVALAETIGEKPVAITVVNTKAAVSLFLTQACSFRGRQA